MQTLTFRPGFSTIIFDCDFTLCRIQGINELADSAHQPEQAQLIHQLTMQVVTGEKNLGDVFAERLALAKPTRAQLLALGQKYIANLVDDVSLTIEALQYLGKKVYIMSHGYKIAIDPLADFLGIPSKHVFAVELEFDQHGNYLTFNKNQPLVQNGGKQKIIAELGISHDEILFIGDGPLDLDVQESVGMFVGYGGVKENTLVKKSVCYYLMGKSLLPILFIATSALEKNLLQTTKYEEAVTKSFLLTEQNLLIKNG